MFSFAFESHLPHSPTFSVFSASETLVFGMLLLGLLLVLELSLPNSLFYLLVLVIWWKARRFLVFYWQWFWRVMISEMSIDRVWIDIKSLYHDYDGKYCGIKVRINPLNIDDERVKRRRWKELKNSIVFEGFDEDERVKRRSWKEFISLLCLKVAVSGGG